MPLQPLRARYERERLLSMLTVFLGVESMREFGLPLRPPWAHTYIVALNTLRYRVLGRLPGGRERLERWGQTLWRRPFLLGGLALFALIGLALPVLKLETAMPSIKVVPESDPSRQGYERIAYVDLDVRW